jgi:predicted RNA-binding Zn ribbon-like protein
VFHFFDDRPVLDFLATIAERGTTDEEKLETGADLARWATESGLTQDVLVVADGELAAAVELREAAYRLLGARIDATAPTDADRELVNAAARRPPPAPQLGADRTLTRSGTLEAVLAALARDCVELAAGPEGDLLRRCDDPKCTRLFLDRSRGGRRRWCDMKGCGDRAKAAAYRRRRRREAA